jgi:hypothetical protein
MPPEQRDLFEAQHWETAYRGFNPDDVPHLLIQLQDDLSRARKREALWLSVILHLLVVILLWNSEKLMELWPHRTVIWRFDGCGPVERRDVFGVAAG